MNEQRLYEEEIAHLVIENEKLKDKIDELQALVDEYQWVLGEGDK